MTQMPAGGMHGAPGSPDDFTRPTPHPGGGGGGCGKFALGCGIVAIVFVIALALGIWYVVANFKSLASDFTARMMVQIIEESELPEDQKQQIVARIHQLRDDFKADLITMEQMGQILEQVTQSPLLQIGAVMWFEQHYINPSSLSDEEKQDGQRSLQRLARGAFEGTISHEVVQQVLEPVSVQKDDDDWQLKEPSQVTDEQLRQVLARAREQADDAGVPDEPFEINLADEFDRAVERALASSPPAKTSQP